MDRTAQPQTVIPAQAGIRVTLMVNEFVLPVIPAQAGIQFVGLFEFRGNSWIPAFAGMTDLNDGLH